MSDIDVLRLREIVNTLGDSANGNESLVIEAHRIINRVIATPSPLDVITVAELEEALSGLRIEPIGRSWSWKQTAETIFDVVRSQRDWRSGITETLVEKVDREFR